MDLSQQCMGTRASKELEQATECVQLLAMKVTWAVLWGDWAGVWGVEVVGWAGFSSLGAKEWVFSRNLKRDEPIWPSRACVRRRTTQSSNTDLRREVQGPPGKGRGVFLAMSRLARAWAPHARGGQRIWGHQRSCACASQNGGQGRAVGWVGGSGLRWVGVGAGR